MQSTNLPLASSWNSSLPRAAVGTPVWSSHTGQHTADALQSQAEELERAAEQLMAAAMQAKTAAFQIKGQGSKVPLVANSSPSTEAQKPRWSLWGSVSKSKIACPLVQSGRTTVMLRNLPNDYNREMLLQLLDAHGFAGHFDFVYLPIDFKRKAGLGYAFVNMTTAAAAEHAFATMQGFVAWQFCSSKVLEVSWGEPLQGLEAHIDRYRNSPVMHADVPENFRPLLFQGGVVVPFPQPTKKVQKPRMKA